MIFSKHIQELSVRAGQDLAAVNADVDAIAMHNTEKVMDAFRNHRVAANFFDGTSGYGYDDRGRDELDLIWAEVFGTEAALVRSQIVSGTHALTTGLFGILRSGDIMLSVAGKPYDTLEEVIGLVGEPGNGSLKDFGVTYDQVDLLSDGAFDLPAIDEKLATYGSRVKMVFIQRSKGYLNRKTLSVAEIEAVAAHVKAIAPDTFVVVDNCYGEFVEAREPVTNVDLLIGSLIKNPGGGMAETGGYLAGSARAVELCSYRLTSPGVGGEVGATFSHNKSFYKGLFYAPHTVSQAIKTAHFAAYMFANLGFRVEPAWDDAPRHDIIQTVIMDSAEGLCAFCRGIQSGSPVDAHVTPEPWDMPGYTDPVIMAAGAFTQGSSIELSADGPLRPPYTAFFQGGLTYESGKLAVMAAADEVWRTMGHTDAE